MNEAERWPHRPQESTRLAIRLNHPHGFSIWDPSIREKAISTQEKGFGR